MKIKIVPFSADNYSYIIIDEETKCAALVDPADPFLVLKEAISLNVKIDSILTTHRHEDHAGGNLTIQSKIGNDLKIYGGVLDDVAGCTHPVSEGCKFNIGNLYVEVIDAPCHTRGHVLFLVRDPKTPNSPAALFSGDTIFVAGCGRFFEGNGEDMYKIIKKLSSLPPDTLLYCGHEYTELNLRFMLFVDPENVTAAKKLEALQTCSPISVPSTIGEELLTNVFFQCDNSKIQRYIAKFQKKNTTSNNNNISDDSNNNNISSSNYYYYLTDELRKMLSFYRTNYAEIASGTMKPYWVS